MDAVQKQWFEQTKLTWFERFLINIIKCRQVPRHIAIIMDGNRRYAKKVQLDQWNCYNLGFEKIRNILKYSHHLGIEEITIFAFSLENFKRDPAETELLMNLATEKFSALLAERDELVKNDVCIRFIGDLTRLPVKLQKLIAELMLLTKDHTTKCLNVCMAYTSSYELSCAANRVYNAVNQNVLSDEIGLEDLSACLLTNRSRTGPELLIRTSGEIRYSDFLLMQCNYSSLSFTPCLWPETTFYEFSKLILQYQLDKLFNATPGIRKVIRSGESKPNPELRAHIDRELNKSLAELLAK